MELNYKASNIARAESELKANFFETLEGLGNGTPSFTALLMILRAGGLTEQKADEIIDNKGIGEALADAINALSHAGFLVKMQQSVTLKEKESKNNHSLNSGETTND